MRVLFDQGVPVPLRRFLGTHEVVTATELGWAELENGDLLAAAEAEEFELMITTDQNLRYQQNLDDRRIGVVVLMTTSWPQIQGRVDQVSQAVEGLAQGGYVEVEI